VYTMFLNQTFFGYYNRGGFGIMELILVLNKS